MKALIQRVKHASVTVENQTIGAIETGLLVLLGVDKADDQAQVEKLVERVLKYRIFADEHGKMNNSLLDIQGQLLVVSQFTLSANTSKGLRPSFSGAATPELAERLYLSFVEQARSNVAKVETGKFGADMQVSLLNDGPVTFLLEV